MAYVASLGAVKPPPSAALDAARARFSAAIDKAVARGADASSVAFWRGLDDGTMWADDLDNWSSNIRGWRPGMTVYGSPEPLILGMDPTALGVAAFTVAGLAFAVRLSRRA